MIDKIKYRDFVLFWDKDIKLAKTLEDKNFKVYNNSKAIEICDDKSKTYIELKKYSIKQPLTFISPLIFKNDLSTDDVFINNILSNLSFPLIIKECFGSFGEQVYLIQNESMLLNKIKELGTKPFIVQEFIKTSFKRDIRIEVINGEVVASILRVNECDDFRANITNGAKAYKYTSNDAQNEMAINACKFLNLDFGGIDILFGEEDEPIFCEANSNAYPLNVSNITGVNIIYKIFKFIISDINK